MKVLVTGGAGYIGSHAVVELINAGHQPVIVDNFSNSNPEVLNRLMQITGQEIPFFELDVRDSEALKKIFDQHQIKAVIHFAGLKAVGESVAQPLKYYRNNIESTLALCEAMQERGIRQLVFSSSATVYGDPEQVPIKESSALHATNPYGQTKLMIEQLLTDLAASDSTWKITLLRYFNPVGAHESGQIGEDPNDIPNNLVPYIAQVAVGRREAIRIFGNDYDTPDGTGVRDYLHVVDLAKGHIKALEKPAEGGRPSIYNLGTGMGVSVLEMIKAFEKACHKQLAYVFDARRAGDIATCYADPSLAAKELGWKAEKSLEDMCADTWRWQEQNPQGFKR